VVLWKFGASCHLRGLDTFAWLLSCWTNSILVTGRRHKFRAKLYVSMRKTNCSYSLFIFVVSTFSHPCQPKTKWKTIISSHQRLTAYLQQLRSWQFVEVILRKLSFSASAAQKIHWLVNLVYLRWRYLLDSKGSSAVWSWKFYADFCKFSGQALFGVNLSVQRGGANWRGMEASVY